MISAARLAANRSNALLSTGPRTASGKAVAAQNGRRHGLASPVAADAALLPQLKSLADRIAGPAATALRRERAWRIAEAELDVLRIRRARAGLLEEAQAGAGRAGSLSASVEKPRTSPWSPARAELSPAGKAARDLLVRLASLDRYERRALSRRKTAVRALDSADDPRLSLA